MPRILLIEDNPANLELMSYLLSAFGYTAKVAMDGVQGLAAAQDPSLDLVVCDVQLPILDGYEIARRLKADPAYRNIPLIAVTALAMVGDRDRILAAGFDGYISKPIDPEKFVHHVESFLSLANRQGKAHPDQTLTPGPRRPAVRHTVLVVDNLPVHLELARSILEPHGYRVLTAGGIAEGFKIANNHPCDLILSDVCMAGESGYDFIRAVKSVDHLRGIPFVFLTSTMASERERAAGLALGATRYLFRPIEPEALLAEIEACLKEHESEGSAHDHDSDRR